MSGTSVCRFRRAHGPGRLKTSSSGWIESGRTECALYKPLKKLALWATIWSPHHALFRIMQGFETAWAVRPLERTIERALRAEQHLAEARRGETRRSRSGWRNTSLTLGVEKKKKLKH